MTVALWAEPLAELLAILVVAPLVGSFLGVVIDRLPAGRPILLGRSTCDACGEALRPRDLVPVVSWLARCGRCACGQRELRAFYPAIELAALAVAISAAWVLSGWLLAVSCALGWTLLCLAVIDHRNFLLPDVLTLPLIPAGLAVAWAIDPALVMDHALGALAGFAAFALIGFGYRRARGREGLGLGDAKLLAAAGAWLGWQALPGVVLIAALGGLALALAGAAGGGKLYPIILLVMSGLSIVVLLTVVVPQFTPLFENAGAELPLLTRSWSASATSCSAGGGCSSWGWSPCGG